MSRFTHLLSRLVPFTAGLLSVAVTALILTALRSWVSTTVVDLLFLLPVVLAATWGGLRSALATSVAAFLVLNYFFLDPKRTLLVRDPNDLLALTIFLFIAVVTSRLVSTANENAARARARELESATLYDLSVTLSTQPGLDEALSSVTRRVAEVFGLAGCEILTRAADGSVHSRARYWASDAAAGRALPTQAPYTQPVDIPLTSNQAPVGTLRLFTARNGEVTTSPAPRMLTTFAAQVGLVVERAQLMNEAARARLLEQANQFKSTLLSSVSHDLRTPLTAIKAATTTLLQLDAQTDPALRHDMLAMIDEEADRLNRLVGDLLDMSRIEGHALQIRCEWLDLDELIHAVVHRLSPRMTSCSVHMNWPADLPLVYADYVQVERVLNNLLDNAVRFAPPGSAIEIAVRHDEAGATISVANQGPAIPAEVQSSLFEKFQRLPEGPVLHAGVGLGLSICKGIVEALGGRIWIESPIHEGIGARFVFTLPYPHGVQPLKLLHEARPTDEKIQDLDR